MMIQTRPLAAAAVIALLAIMVMCGSSCLRHRDAMRSGWDLDERMGESLPAFQFVRDYEEYLSGEDTAAPLLEDWYKNDAIRPDVRAVLESVNTQKEAGASWDIKNVQILVNVGSPGEDGGISTVRTALVFADVVIVNEPFVDPGASFVSFDVVAETGRSGRRTLHRHFVSLRSDCDVVTGNPRSKVIAHFVHLLPVDSTQGLKTRDLD